MNAKHAKPISAKHAEPINANTLRGEAQINVADTSYVLKPSFAALVAAEAELGSLFALIDRAAEGTLSLHDIATLFWHCVAERPNTLTRNLVGDAVVAMGLAGSTPALRTLLSQIMLGR